MPTNSSFAEPLALPVTSCVADGFPPPAHPGELDLYCRQTAMPGHDQPSLASAHILVVGCGGLGGWAAVAMARMGVRRLTLVDPDRFDRTNAPRQLLYPDDVGRHKAHIVAAKVAREMTRRGTVVGIARPIQRAIQMMDDPPTALFVGVDNNEARLEAARYALDRDLPASFAMLSADGMRGQALLQVPGGACLFCMLPNLDADIMMACAAAAIPSCWLASTHAIYVLTSFLMGRADECTWREISLDGSTERRGKPPRRRDCPLCGGNTPGSIAGWRTSGA